jgi:hypothetical protein
MSAIVASCRQLEVRVAGPASRRKFPPDRSTAASAAAMAFGAAEASNLAALKPRRGTRETKAPGFRAGFEPDRRIGPPVVGVRHGGRIPQRDILFEQRAAEVQREFRDPFHSAGAVAVLSESEINRRYGQWRMCDGKLSSTPADTQAPGWDRRASAAPASLSTSTVCRPALTFQGASRHTSV